MTTYALKNGSLMIHKCVLIVARIVIHIFVVVTNTKVNSVQSLDRHSQQNSCFVASCNTNSSLITLCIPAFKKQLSFVVSV